MFASLVKTAVVCLLLSPFMALRSQDIKPFEDRLTNIINDIRYAFEHETTVEGLQSEINDLSYRTSALMKELESIKDTISWKRQEHKTFGNLLQLTEHVDYFQKIKDAQLSCLTYTLEILNLLNAKLLFRDEKNEIIVRIVNIGNFNLAFSYTKDYDTRKVTVGYKHKGKQDNGLNQHGEIASTYYLMNGSVRFFDVSPCIPKRTITSIVIKELEHKPFDRNFRPNCKNEYPRN